MFYQQFIKDFSTLGLIISKWLTNKENNVALDNAAKLACQQNPFFTLPMIRYALSAISKDFLNKEALSEWIKKYDNLTNRDTSNYEKFIGIIAAGNIPLVVFHDFLCVMACKKRALIKLSSKDNLFFPAIVNELYKINNFWRDQIFFTNTINPDDNNVEKIIFMGSDKTAIEIRNRYINKPMLIRSSRFSFAILNGNESNEEILALGKDIFLYYGLGCRSVSTLFIPQNYDINTLVKKLSPLKELVSSNHYKNIYAKNKAIAIMDNENFIDGNFFIIKNNSPKSVPIGVLNYIRYTCNKDISDFEEKFSDSIQKKYSNFGVAQNPRLDEYPDNKDTIQFIMNK
jgi:Acyl-CoA reductase (LuxC).